MGGGGLMYIAIIKLQSGASIFLTFFLTLRLAALLGKGIDWRSKSDILGRLAIISITDGLQGASKHKARQLTLIKEHSQVIPRRHSRDGGSYGG